MKYLILKLIVITQHPFSNGNVFEYRNNSKLRKQIEIISYAFIEELFLTKITSKKSRNTLTVNISLP
jgi:hypothetical protein